MSCHAVGHALSRRRVSVRAVLQAFASPMPLPSVLFAFREPPPNSAHLSDAFAVFAAAGRVTATIAADAHQNKRAVSFAKKRSARDSAQPGFTVPLLQRIATHMPHACAARKAKSSQTTTLDPLCPGTTPHLS